MAPGKSDMSQVEGPKPHERRRRYRETFTRGQIAVTMMPVLGAFAVAAVIVVAGQRPVRISIEDGDFAVFGGGYRARVPISEMTDVSLDDSGLRVGRRLNGHSLGGVLRGKFNCRGVGECQVFVDLDKPPFLIVRSPGATVMVNGESPAETRQVYRDLKSRLESVHRDAGSPTPPEEPEPGPVPRG